jgi:tRNA modification GTPase
VADPSDTIVALASAAGRAGVAVIRVSGPAADQVLLAMTGAPLPPPRMALLRTLRRSGGDFLDEALVIRMPAPHSYTGEDVAELHTHGGTVVVAAVIEAVLACGAAGRPVRLAEPGEFTRRAFAAGRIDMLQAEAVADLIDAETEGQRAQAARLYQGEASRRIEGWRQDLLRAFAALEAAIDFPDEADLPEDIAQNALAPARRLREELDAALGQADLFRTAREGVRAVILGAPNAGKSSLLNRLAGWEAAIVSDIPGTTRDVVEVRLVLGGVPVWVADTAGLREAADRIEAEGVKRALARAESADLRIWVTAADETSADSANVSRETLARPGDIEVLTKADLAPEAAPQGVLRVSAVTGEGLAALEAALTQRARALTSSQEPPVITRARHKALVEAARDQVHRAIEAAERGLGPELVAEDLRLAARSLGRITGAVDVEDILGEIFARFCIGK